MNATPPGPTTFGQLPPSTWPGERLGLPRSGRHSVGRVGRRILALVIDWAIAVGLACLIWGYTLLDYDGFVVLGVFVLLQAVLLATLGASIGHLLVGLRLISLSGGPVGVWRPLVRSVLLGLAVPALVWDSDQRGFHDKIAGTVLIRR
ncbi:RDD family protein [Cryobacterium sp. PAMC25264]|uniref:RDD family protein n=1 Tax=Cryobacterium sp. PAMC25264 TaxID=2861288 RepID=UPI001C626F57|nr:RDD family protein [Cryobacterium sp. PAMC25264]QYF74827.1 RDD family protein [Cryobacterium sp. PAMC25264]